MAEEAAFEAGQETKKVRIKVSFEMDWDVPSDWDDDMVLFHLNESSMCMDSLLQARLRQSDGDVGCTCELGEAVLIKKDSSGG